MFSAVLNLVDPAQPQRSVHLPGLLHTQFGKLVRFFFTSTKADSEFCGALCSTTPRRQLLRLATVTLSGGWRVLWARERLDGDKALWSLARHKSAGLRASARRSCSDCTPVVAGLRIKRDLIGLVGAITRDGFVSSAQLDTACTAPYHCARHRLQRRQDVVCRASAAAAEIDGET